jgi:hypothetical protein
MERQIRFVDGRIELFDQGEWRGISKPAALLEVQGWTPARSNQLVLKCRRLDRKTADYIFSYPRMGRDEVPLQVGPHSVSVDPKKFGKHNTGFRIVEHDPRPGNGNGDEQGTMYPVVFEVEEVVSFIERPPVEPEYTFHVQTERWTTKLKSMGGLELKHFVRIPANYSCRQEKPEEAEILDEQSVDLTCGPRFIFVPPASY